MPFLVKSNRVADAVSAIMMAKEILAEQDNGGERFLDFFDSVCGFLERGRRLAPFKQRVAPASKEQLSLLYNAALDSIEDKDIKLITKARLQVAQNKPIEDLGAIAEIVNVLKDHILKNDILLRFLYLEKSLIGEQIEGILYDYCQNNEIDPLIDDIEEDEELIENDPDRYELSKWCVGIVKHSDRLKEMVFKYRDCGSFSIEELYSCASRDDWDSFSRYLSLGLGEDNSYPESYLYFLKNESKKWISCNDDDYDHDEKISRSLIRKENVGALISALEQLCEMSQDSGFYEDLVDIVESLTEDEEES